MVMIGVANGNVTYGGEDIVCLHRAMTRSPLFQNPIRSISPEMDSLSIFPATREQILESRRRTWTEWGRGLSLEAYVQREEMLDSQPHAKNGKMTIWVLAPRIDSTTLDFLSSCETYNREAVISTSSSPVVAYGIASVFTPERHREKGYAKHLMRLLHFVLADLYLLPPFPIESWGAPPIIPSNVNFPYARGIASALYSDVGSKFYDLCGPGIGMVGKDKAWTEHDPIGTIWPVGSGEKPAEDIEWISESELAGVWDLDAAMIKKQIHDTLNPHTTFFSFLPNHGVAQFLIERNKHLISKDTDIELMWGAKIAADSDGTRCPYFATWSLDPGRSGPSTLIITRLRANPSTLGRLLGAAKKVAGDLALDQVEVWNLEPELSTLAKELGGETGRREDHLPALAWYGQGDVVWRFNDKFCWC